MGIQERQRPSISATAPPVPSAHPPIWRQHKDLNSRQVLPRGVSTWGKQHRLDAGRVEDADDRIPGPHPPATQIPISA